MPLTLIRGEFRIVGASPDGDSIRFYPNNLAAWEDAHISVRSNARGGVQLRLEAIDALETHYTPRSSPGPWRQNTALSDGASTALLAILGFDKTIRGDRGTITSAEPAVRPGAILTRFADKYGRAVAFAYADDEQPDGQDGAAIYLEPDGLAATVNGKLLHDGWVYPTFYSKLYPDLREALATVTHEARVAKDQLWELDATNLGFTLTSRAQLTESLVVLPKLFRRLADYLTLDDTGSTDLAGFKGFLQSKNDKLFTMPTGHATHFDTLVEVNGQHITLTALPEQIVFIEA